MVEVSLDFSNSRCFSFLPASFPPNQEPRGNPVFFGCFEITSWTMLMQMALDIFLEMIYLSISRSQEKPSKVTIINWFLWMWWSLFLIRYRCVEHVLKLSENWAAVPCPVSMCPASKKANNLLIGTRTFPGSQCFLLRFVWTCIWSYKLYQEADTAASK